MKNRLRRFARFGTALILLAILVLIDTTSQDAGVNYAIGPLVVPAITAGAYLLGTLFNYFSQKDANDKNRKAQLDINRQQTEAVERSNKLQREWQNEDFNRVNSFNHPAQQMIRLREAGLNPNLVYGSGAQTTAQAIKTMSPEIPRLEAPKMAPQMFDVSSIGDSVSTMYNIRAQDTDIAIKREQLNLLQQQQLKNNLQMAGMATKNDLSARLVDSTLQAATLRNEKMIAENANLEATNHRIWKEVEMLDLKANLNVAQAEKVKAEIVNIMSSSRLRNIDAELRMPLAIVGSLSKFGLQRLIPQILPKVKGGSKAMKMSTSEWQRTNRLMFDR